MSFDMWIAFATAWLILTLAPGPDNIFVLIQSVIYGRRDALWVVAGLCTGLTVHIFLVAVGVSALIRASYWAFMAVKIAGAAYLVYLAVLAWKAPAAKIKINEPGKKPKRTSAAALWRRGTIMNLTNPKVIIFFLAFLPQFMVPTAQPLLQISIMALTIVATCLLVFGTIAVCADKVRGLISSSTFQRRLNRTGAVIFVGLALNMLITR